MRIPLPFDRQSFALWRRFYAVMRPHVRYVRWLAVLLVLEIPVSLASPLVIKVVVDDAIERSSLRHLYFWAGLLAALTVATVLIGLVSDYCTTLFRTHVVRSLRVRLFRHLQRLSLGYFQDHETGFLMSRQLDDVGALSGVMADTLARACVNAVKSLAFTVALFYVEWRMALGGLVFVGVLYLFQTTISAPLRRRSRTASERWTAFTETLHQAITGHYLVRTTSSEAREAQRYAHALHVSLRASLRRELYALWTSRLFSLVGGVAPPLIIVAGSYLIVTGEFTIGSLFAFFLYLQLMLRSVSSVAGVNPAVQSSLIALERIYEVLDTEPEIETPSGVGEKRRVRGRVTFEDVTFAYEQEPVLRDVDLDVAPSTMVALVGPSGAGKTTMVHLIPRFFDPTAGRLLIDGVDLRTLDLKSYRRQVGIVPQDVFLFDRTIAENIAYGRTGASREEVRRAARAANADEFIADLPRGYDTLVGERGTRLSGGQRQRIAIAREILRDPRILILDEATSSLDSRSEGLIQEALYKLLAGRTAFVIAHRLSTVVRADLILVLDRGRIREAGRHAELLANDRLYAELYRAQLRRPAEEALTSPSAAAG